jgi:hypothetical protein
VLIRLPEPRRPDVEDRRARTVLDWVQTAAFTFWTIFTVVVAVTLFLEGAGWLADLSSLL